MKLWAAVMTMALASTGCGHIRRTEQYLISETTDGIGIGPGTGGTGDDLCQEELENCMKSCWGKRQWPYPHNKEQSGWYYKRCTADCNRQFMSCEEEREEAARSQEKRLEFSRMSEALEWIRENKNQVALGTLIIVAGVVFFVTTGAAGALLLAPLAI